MKNLITLVALTFSISAVANSVSDLPRTFMSCEETYGGAVVLDGAKRLTLSKDQFGQVYLNVTRRDRFNDNFPLVVNIPVRAVRCNGYVPCEKYFSEHQEVKFGINYGPKIEGFLFSSTLGQIEFFCKKN